MPLVIPHLDDFHPDVQVVYLPPNNFTSAADGPRRHRQFQKLHPRDLQDGFKDGRNRFRDDLARLLKVLQHLKLHQKH